MSCAVTARTFRRFDGSRRLEAQRYSYLLETAACFVFVCLTFRKTTNKSDEIMKSVQQSAELKKSSWCCINWHHLSCIFAEPTSKLALTASVGYHIDLHFFGWVLVQVEYGSSPKHQSYLSLMVWAHYRILAMARSSSSVTEHLCQLPLYAGNWCASPVPRCAHSCGLQWVL